MIRFLLGAAFLLAVLDILLLLLIGIRFGLMPVLAIVFLPSMIGGGIARQQGAQSLGRAQSLLLQGAAPSSELLDGVTLLVASLLLLYPGPISTTLGLILLIPWPRRWLASFVLWCLKRAFGISISASQDDTAPDASPFGAPEAEPAQFDSDGLKRVDGEDLGSSPLAADERPALPGDSDR